jgi:ubiquinone/menaquinone biosynthesis C-methylase UbiE
MNWIENWFCGTAMWRRVTERKLVPWLVAGYELGEHVLEVGAGPGATTRALRDRAKRITSLEVDSKLVVRLAKRHNHKASEVLQGDAAALPFASERFSAVIAILVLHHMKSSGSQNHAFEEFYRVLRPGGLFLAFEIQDGWVQRMSHIKSTFVPVSPSSVFARLATAGFSRISVDVERGAYRVGAMREIVS